MALLNRFSKLNDRAETGIFTFIVTKSVTRDFHRDATTKDFCFGYHRWAISFQRPTEKMLGVHLLLRNASPSTACVVDFTLTLLNREHFSQNQVYSKKQAKFTITNPMQGVSRWIELNELAERRFSNETGEFLFELSLSNMTTIFECDIQLNSIVLNQYKQMLKFGSGNLQQTTTTTTTTTNNSSRSSNKHQHGQNANNAQHQQSHQNHHHHHQSHSQNQLINLDTNQFSFGSFEWSLTIVPLVVASSGGGAGGGGAGQQQQQRYSNSSASSSQDSFSLTTTSADAAAGHAPSDHKKGGVGGGGGKGQKGGASSGSAQNTQQPQPGNLEPVCRVYLNRLSGFDSLCRVKYRVILGHHQPGNVSQSSDFVDSKLLDQISDCDGRIRGHQFRHTNVLKLVSLRQNSQTGSGGQQQQQQQQSSHSSMLHNNNNNNNNNKSQHVSTNGSAKHNSSARAGLPDLRVHIEMFCANTISEARVPLRRTGNAATGAAQQSSGRESHDAIANCSDRNKQNWCVECDQTTDEMIKLKLFFMDLQSVPRNHIRYISWIAYLVRLDPKTGQMRDSLAVKNSPHSNYYLQDGMDLGTIMETELQVAELNKSPKAYLDAEENLTVHIEWVDSLLLFSHLYNNYDALATVQRHQISRELFALQQEFDYLEGKYLQSQRTLNRLLSESNNADASSRVSASAEVAANNGQHQQQRRSMSAAAARDHRRRQSSITVNHSLDASAVAAVAAASGVSSACQETHDNNGEDQEDEDNEDNDETTAKSAADIAMSATAHTNQESLSDQEEQEDERRRRRRHHHHQHYQRQQRGQLPPTLPLGPSRGLSVSSQQQFAAAAATPANRQLELTAAAGARSQQLMGPTTTSGLVQLAAQTTSSPRNSYNNDNNNNNNHPNVRCASSMSLGEAHKQLQQQQQQQNSYNNYLASSGRLSGGDLLLLAAHSQAHVQVDDTTTPALAAHSATFDSASTSLGAAANRAFKNHQQQQQQQRADDLNLQTATTTKAAGATTTMGGQVMAAVTSHHYQQQQQQQQPLGLASGHLGPARAPSTPRRRLPPPPKVSIGLPFQLQRDLQASAALMTLASTEGPLAADESCSGLAPLHLPSVANLDFPADLHSMATSSDLSTVAAAASSSSSSFLSNRFQQARHSADSLSAPQARRRSSGARSPAHACSPLHVLYEPHVHNARLMSVSSISNSGSFMQQQQQQQTGGSLLDDSSASSTRIGQQLGRGSFASIDLVPSSCNKNGNHAAELPHDNHGASSNANHLPNHRPSLAMAEQQQQQQHQTSRHQYAKRTNDNGESDDETCETLVIASAAATSLPLEYTQQQRQECELMLNGSGFQNGAGLTCSSSSLLGAGETSSADELIAIASSNNDNNNNNNNSVHNKAALRQHRSSIEVDALYLNKSGLVLNRANHQSTGPLIGTIDHLYHHDYQADAAAAAAPSEQFDQLRLSKQQHSALRADIERYGAVDLQPAPVLNSINYRSSSPGAERAASSWQMTLGRGLPYDEPS